MNIYKLNYENTEVALKDLKAKGVYVEIEDELCYGQEIEAVVEIGKIIKTQGIYDGENTIEEPTFYDGVFYDIMTKKDFDFGLNEMHPKNCTHSFAGYETNEEILIDNE